MKKSLLVLLFLAGMTLVAKSVSAAVIFYGNGPAWRTTHVLDSTTIDGTPVDLGVAFKQFDIFWIPLWNYGTPEYVFIAKYNDDDAWATDAEDLAYVQETYGIDTSVVPRIPFWDRIGGKLVAVAVIALLLLLDKRRKKRKRSSSCSAPTADAQ